MNIRLAACGVLAGFAFAAACAHVEAPPGGTVATEPPRLIATRPDTFARVRSYLGPAVFVFDETLSEKGIDTVVTVSPRTSSMAVDKHGHEVRVSLRRGWENDRIYQVTVHPGVQDLFGNIIKTPSTIVFSTGPEIVHTVARGRVIDRVTLAPATGAVIEAMRMPDTIPFVTRPDSAGSWTLEYLPPGDYLVRGYNDTNKDQRLQPYEARDTATIHVTLHDTAQSRRLAIIAPDTSPPKAGGATAQDSIVEVRFDDFLDPAQTVSPAQVTVTGPNGPVRVVAARVGPFADMLRDSAGADTGVARRDTARAARNGRANGRPGSAAGDTGRAARRDTAPAEPLPSQSVFVRVATPVVHDAPYTVTVTGVRNLLGLAGGGTVQLRTARAAPPPSAPATDTVTAKKPAPGQGVTGSRAPGQPNPPPPAPPRPPGAPPPLELRPFTSPRAVPLVPRRRGWAAMKPGNEHLFL